MKEQILNNIKKAMLSKNSFELNMWRLIKAEFSQVENAKDAKELTPDAEITVLKKMVKERIHSIEEYTKANRFDLVEKEQQEVDFINTFIPKSISNTALEGSITAIIMDNKLTDMKGMGVVMTNLKSLYGSAFDGKTAGEIYKRLITNTEQL
jgi:uncharacterized protein YqeY